MTIVIIRTTPIVKDTPPAIQTLSLKDGMSDVSSVGIVSVGSVSLGVVCIIGDVDVVVVVLSVGGSQVV